MKIQSGKETEYAKYVEVNSADPYSKECVDYGERWANLMEAKITEGRALEDVAQDSSHEADTEGITGFMYGCAVHGLANFWEHGETLRRWHNKQYGHGEDTQGTVNPAVLTIG